MKHFNEKLNFIIHNMKFLDCNGQWFHNDDKVKLCDGLCYDDFGWHNCGDVWIEIQ